MWDRKSAIFAETPGKASKVYAELCARYAASAPGAEWNGEYVMEHK